jgi:nucleoside phosphorylase
MNEVSDLVGLFCEAFKRIFSDNALQEIQKVLVSKRIFLTLHVNSGNVLSWSTAKFVSSNQFSQVRKHPFQQSVVGERRSGAVYDATLIANIKLVVFRHTPSQKKKGTKTG